MNERWRKDKAVEIVDGMSDPAGAIVFVWHLRGATCISIVH